jgi:hypothetical protein
MREVAGPHESPVSQSLLVAQTVWLFRHILMGPGVPVPFLVAAEGPQISPAEGLTQGFDVTATQLLAEIWHLL